MSQNIKLKEIIHTRKFYLYNLKGWIEDIYIAVYPQKILLLDGASIYDTNLIIDFITSYLKRQINELKLSVSTHLHPDHSAAAFEIRKKYKIPIAAYHNIDEWYEGCGGKIQHRIDSRLGTYVARKKQRKSKLLKHPRFIRPDFKLHSNVTLPFFDDWQVIEAGGHTHHQICLYNLENEILYAADVFLRIGTNFQLPYPVDIPQMMIETLDRLKNIEIKTVLLAHSGTYRDFNFVEIFENLKNKIGERPRFPIYLLAPFVKNNTIIRRYKKTTLR